MTREETLAELNGILAETDESPTTLEELERCAERMRPLVSRREWLESWGWLVEPGSVAA